MTRRTKASRRFAFRRANETALWPGVLTPWQARIARRRLLAFVAKRRASEGT